MTELEMLHQEKVLHENDVRELLRTLSGLKDEYKRQQDILGEHHPALLRIYLNSWRLELELCLADELGMGDEVGAECGVEVELMELESDRVTISETLERWKEGRVQTLEAASHFSNVLKRLREATG